MPPLGSSLKGGSEALELCYLAVSCLATPSREGLASPVISTRGIDEGLNIVYLKQSSTVLAHVNNPAVKVGSYTVCNTFNDLAIKLTLS
jgi:hypothetical protein